MMDDKLGLLVMTAQLRMKDQAGLIEAPTTTTTTTSKPRKRKQRLKNGPSLLLKRKKRVGAAAEKNRENLKLITDYLSKEDNSVQGKSRFRILSVFTLM